MARRVRRASTGRGRRVRIEHAVDRRRERARPRRCWSSCTRAWARWSMWRDFPQRLCDARRLPRPGLFAPRLRPLDAARGRRAWGLDFMHRQAHEVLPALLRGAGRRRARAALAVRPQRRRLDRAAATPHASRRGWPARSCWRRTSSSRTCRCASIEQRARGLSATPTCAQRLARHHDDPDSAFWGWNRHLAATRRSAQWTIEAEIDAIRCPLLAVQGLDDEYGTLEQIRGIARRVPQTRLLELPDCGHSPHRDQPEAVIAAAVEFICAAASR